MSIVITAVIMYMTIFIDKNSNKYYLYIDAVSYYNEVEPTYTILSFQ